ncbi:hypothetical protein KI387_033521 [Taxus chinensis]|uniref:Uncharacterized protein n=1 Tax=Taxus chinensis TaxID=29808 RepID=A0AA38F1P4_TAXCH|nr:hypothetical protein KI387_033521 [Taxus chinensis]
MYRAIGDISSSDILIMGFRALASISPTEELASLTEPSLQSEAMDPSRHHVLADHTHSPLRFSAHCLPLAQHGANPSLNITVPLTCCATVVVLLHVPINLMLVVYLKMGIRGVAVAAVWSNLNLGLSLLGYLSLLGVYKKSWEGVSKEYLKGWRSLLSLAIPSYMFFCLEWWWYEFMIILCSLLINPKATLASMGILIQTIALVYIFPSSLSLGVSTRVGNELGGNRPTKARIAMIVVLLCAGMLGLLALTFTIIMRHKWDRMFTQDTNILQLTSLALLIVGLCKPTFNL